MGPAIRTRGLGKMYRIATTLASPRRSAFEYKSLRDSLAGLPTRLVRRARGPSRVDFWALRDVDIEIAGGEAVAIIGGNGAGKTTLLKVLSRITPPTAGTAEVRGRVGVLLEVGTGFHPELTGRENVYLSGAILGMSRRDIDARFDAIVDFSEIEGFIDTPVKHYSPGMYARLGFSVAAHLEPDILIVDEVLSVGDVAFQKKCLGRMDDDARTGRTVLFVSHNMAAVRLLTHRAIHISAGRVVDDGRTADVVATYLRALERNEEGFVDLTRPEARASSTKITRQDIVFRSVRFVGRDGATTTTFEEHVAICIELEMEARSRTSLLEALLWVSTEEGVLLFTAMSGRTTVEIRPGLYRWRCEIDPNPFLPGRYQVALSLWSAVAQDSVPAAARFEVVANPLPTDDPRYAQGSDYGIIRTPSRWSPILPAAR